MRKFISLAMVFVATAILVVFAAANQSRANGVVALTGQVSSQRGGLIEGVMVGT